jgi:SPP1 family predicted phage head-tail adaptor
MRAIPGGATVKIAAGELDRRMSILVRGSGDAPEPFRDAFGQVQDGLGQIVETWTPAGSTYAKRLELRTSDAARAGGRDTFSVSRFLIRYRTDITTRHRVIVDGITFDILAIDSPDRRETMVLTVEEVMQ